ncbi:AraC family transcriptional regulator [Actinomadura violacea]|uniref:Helix-turn-helix transcriptional regulator n=1 Tax=Actinomadura violacea TaxID=2819934 RepID=A0ABS3RS49_9ACTN|nr:helix-turn-helix transcriptional regulator [Actinomadura violacea]MBO2459482.1 helix-turn-helix transcriptional regulator [Actinomadura violacea]
MTRHTPRASTGLRLIPPGGGIDPHRHDDHQLAYAVSGVLSVTTDAGIWLASPARALWIPAGTVHEHRSFGGADLRLVGIPVPRDPLGLARPAVLGVDALLRELIVACTDVPDAERDGAEWLRLRDVLLDRVARAPRYADYVPSAKDPRLAAVCRMLCDDPADDRTLAELGARAGAGERTLTRLFRAELGMTFPQWRAQLRLHHAMVLLAEGLPVTTVAHRAGWASASAFIDAFRRTFGHTPGTHRARVDGRLLLR